MQSFTPPAAGKSRRFRGLICHRRSQIQPVRAVASPARSRSRESSSPGSPQRGPHRKAASPTASERLKTGVDDCLVGVQLVGHRRTGRIPSRTGGQIPLQLAGIDPIVDRPTIHPEPSRQLRLRDRPGPDSASTTSLISHLYIRAPIPFCWQSQQNGPDTPSATSPK